MENLLHSLYVLAQVFLVIYLLIGTAIFYLTLDILKEDEEASEHPTLRLITAVLVGLTWPYAFKGKKSDD